MANYALFRCHLLVFLLLSIVVLTRQDVPLGSSLTASDDGASWTSPSGEFAFGFRRLDNSDLFIVAVWFDKIPEKTIVWSANGYHPVQKGSKIELTSNGELVLYNLQGQEIWKPKAVSGRATSASMLDTGNFVLLSTDSSHIWGSFDEPTDTILPTQVLDKPSELSSRRTVSDYSNGKFQLRLQSDGNLELYLVAVPSDYPYGSYWSTDTIGSGSQLIFNESGYLYLLKTNGYIINLTPKEVTSTTKGFYHRVTLDFDGVLRQYIYPKTQPSKGTQSWAVVWYEPSNMCLAVINSLGSGTCGYNSYCRLGVEKRPICECPPGYTYLDPNNTYGGCKPEFKAQSCEMGGLKEASGYEMKEVIDIDWPLNDYEKYSPVDEELCREICLEDCFCYVSVFGFGDTCWKKRVPLSNGKMDPSVQRKTYIKVAKANSSFNNSTSPSCVLG